MINLEALIASIKPTGRFVYEVSGRRWHHIKHGEYQFTEPKRPRVKLYSEDAVSSLIAALEQAQNERDKFKFAFTEWHDKTAWVQEEVSPDRFGFQTLGMHRADVMTRHIEELENDEVRQRLANAEHQLHMAELAKHNLKASRKAQFRKRKVAEQRIAELEAAAVKPVKLTEEIEREALRYRFLRDSDMFGDQDEPGLANWEQLGELAYNEFDKAVDARIDHPNIDYRELDARLMKHRIADKVAEVKPVKLPEGYAIRAGHPIYGEEKNVMIPKEGGNWLSRFDVEHAIRVAGGTVEGSAVAVTDGWVMVPKEPTEDMVIAGFESKPNESFSELGEWEAYEAMSGCQQAAHRAKLCWAAMLAAAPQQEKTK